MVRRARSAAWLGMVATLFASGTGKEPTRDLKAYYQRHCAQCHGAEFNARGAGGQRLPGRNLTDPRWRSQRTDEQLLRSIQEGLRAMPGYKAQLSEGEIRRLVQEVLPAAPRRK